MFQDRMSFSSSFLGGVGEAANTGQGGRRVRESFPSASTTMAKYIFEGGRKSLLSKSTKHLLPE